MKKQLEETIPESTKQLTFSSFRSEIEYLREENRTKTLIIKQLTENKAMTCSCNVVRTTRMKRGNITTVLLTVNMAHSLHFSFPLTEE